MREDTYNLIENLESLTDSFDNHFTENDIESAIKNAKEYYYMFTRKRISKMTAIQMLPNKRNYRKQDIHLMGARAKQEINDKVNGTNLRKGNGRKSKFNVVLNYVLNNPNISKYRCINIGLNV